MATDKKPSTLEEEYFAREDAERLRKLHADEQSSLRQSQKDALRNLHQGRCSNCGAQLVPEQVSGLVIQHCPACGGAFLDKRAWDTLHAHAAPHTVMGDVLNWFKAGSKP